MDRGKEMKGKTLLLFVFASFSLFSCVSTGYNTQKGALIGAGVGAIAGQAIGRNTEATLIGAQAGALVGAIVGNAFDQELMWRTQSKTPSLETYQDGCPPGKWVEVPGRWKDGKWVPSHKVWVPQDP